MAGRRDAPVLTVPRLAAALAIIALLAFVLPAVAVRVLHGRRLTRVDRDLQMIAESLRARPGVSADAMLSGPGERPRAEDPQWNTAAVLPLAIGSIDTAVTADPWGNAYVACGQAPPLSGAWVLSAGPDGILQTPYHVPQSSPAGDDRGARIR